VGGKQARKNTKKEFEHAAAMIFSVKTSCSSIKKISAIRVGDIFMETGVQRGWHHTSGVRVQISP
jgi:hypothetical protein